MYHQKQGPDQKEAGSYERRYPSVRGGKKRGAIANRASNDQSKAHFNQSPSKGGSVNNGDDLGKSVPQRSGSDDVRRQKLTEINDLKQFIFKGYLEITLENYKNLIQYASTYETAFKRYDRGVALKGWKSSLGFEPLLDLLYAFEKVNTFKANIEWDKDGDVGETLARAIQFYEGLTELHLSHCKLTDKAIMDIMKSLKYPEKLKVLNVKDNSLTKPTLAALKQHFPNLTKFKHDEELSELQTPIRPGGVYDQELSEIIDLQEFFHEEDLEITPENYKTLVQYADTYEAAFKRYDGGIALNGWKSSLGFKPLLDLLYAFEAIKSFKADIEWDNDEDAGETLARAVQFYEDLAELHLSNCRLTDKSLKSIIKSLKYPEKLRILDTQGNSLTKSTLVVLRRRLPNLIPFKSDESLIWPQNLMIVLTHSPITSHAFSPLHSSSAPPFVKVGKITIFFAGWKDSVYNFHKPWSTVLSREFKFDEKTLILKDIQFDPEACKFLSMGLFLHAKLHAVSLTNCQIDDGCVKSLTTYLPHSKLTELSLFLDGNQISDEGAKALAFILPKLSQLILSRNRIGDEGTKALAGKSPESPISVLWLDNNQIGDEGVKALAAVLPRSKIATLALDSNQIGDAGAKALADALPQSKISSLSLCKNPVGDEAIKEFEMAFRRTPYY